MNRREFLKTTSAALSASTLLAGSERLFADGPETLNVALVGCGGRGMAALENFIEAAGHRNIRVHITALADYFETRITSGIERLEKFKQTHPFTLTEDCGRVGVKAYRDVMKTDADVVLLVTPPNFRPIHFEAAVQAGKHVFMEKPVAVDPPGARSIAAVGAIAKQKGLSVAAGTQRRHQLEYLNTKYAVDKGLIGPIRAASVWWCMGRLWYKERNPGEEDASYLIHNWVNFTELSGDHIVEQHVHQLDIANWFIGRYPKTAIGFGGRARRKTGNQYDFFSVEFDYGDDVNVHSMCRQVDGTYNRVAELFTGTTGQAWGSGQGGDHYPPALPRPHTFYTGNPYVQEHLDLIDSITKKGDYLNEADTVAMSTLTGIMGRISAYTGQLIRWKDLASNERSPWYNLTCRPTAADFEAGSVTAPPDDVIAVPGK